MNNVYVGDILELFKKYDKVAIIHGNNCENNMGKGLAKTLKDKFLIFGNCTILTY